MIFAAAVLMPLALMAQSDRYEQRYNLLVSKLGPAGVGVETVINAWEKADSTSSNMLLAKFNYYFTKSQTSEVVSKPGKKYLGMDPVLNLKDSTGTDIYYYQENMYDDELYGMAVKAADKAISIYPEKLDFRFIKNSTHCAYVDAQDNSGSWIFADMIYEFIAKTDKRWTWKQSQKLA